MRAHKIFLRKKGGSPYETIPREEEKCGTVYHSMHSHRGNRSSRATSSSRNRRPKSDSRRLSLSQENKGRGLNIQGLLFFMRRNFNTENKNRPEFIERAVFA